MDPVHEWKQVAQNGAHIVDLIFTARKVKNVEFCVGRDHALNAAEEVEHAVVEMAEFFELVLQSITLLDFKRFAEFDVFWHRSLRIFQ